MTPVTQLLDAAAAGDRKAASELLPLVYDQLRKLAAARMAAESPGQTLEATALVHEAYLRLVGPADDHRWNSRGHFFAAAAEAMRRILIDQARQKNASRHGGGRRRVSLDEANRVADSDAPPMDDLLALDGALQKLEAEEPVKARLVKLRYFAGVPLEDAARMLGISPATAKRYWVYARSWLYGKLHTD
jgi:RNA polymerase sigma factor (TIGR02999 family)